MPATLRIGQEVPHALLLRLADQRADVQVHRRRADAQAVEGLAQALEQRLVDRLLTSRREPAEQVWPAFCTMALITHRQRRVEVGVGEHDLRALAAQLQRHRAVALGRHLLDQRADAAGCR